MQHLQAGGPLMTAVYLVLAAVVILGGWYVHVRLFPWRTCPRCGGRGRIGASGVHRDCARCRATGRVRRIGARKEE